MNLVCQAQAAEKNQVATQKMSSLSEEKLIILLQAMNNFDEINNFFMTSYQNKIRDLREVHVKSLNEMEELKRFQGSYIRWIFEKKIDCRDTIIELTAKIQELQNDVNCMNDSRVFKDAESVRSGQSHVTSQPAFFPTFPRSWRNAKPSSGNAEPQR